MSNIQYPVTSGYISENSVKLIIASLSNIEDERSVAEKMESLGFNLQDYLDLFADERFQNEFLDYNVKMQIFPRMPTFFQRHMIAASKGGRGSARVVKWILQSYFKRLAESQKQTNVQINANSVNRETSEIAGELVHIRDNVLPSILGKFEKDLDPKGESKDIAQGMLEVVVKGEIVSGKEKSSDNQGADQQGVGDSISKNATPVKRAGKKKGSNKDGGLSAPSGPEGIP